MAQPKPFWLVAFPQEYNADKKAVGFSKLSSEVNKLGEVVNFDIPGDLKIGTLDQLMSISESLAKVDVMIASTLGRVYRSFSELKSEGRGNREDATPIEIAVKRTTPQNYVKSFKWEFVKYKPSSSLQSITDGIEQDVRGYDEDIKKLTHMRAEVNSTLEGIKRTDNGTLLVRPLGPIIKKRVISPSPSLETIFVVVPLKKKEEFLSTYETMEQGYKARKLKKMQEEEEHRKEQAKSEIAHGIPALIKEAKEDRNGVLQGGSVYKHIAELLRKAKNLDQKELDTADGQLKECRTLLEEAIEIKLAPYAEQGPNNSGAKNAVLDVVLTAEEYKIESKSVVECRKMVEELYTEAKSKIDRVTKEMKEGDKNEQQKLNTPYVVPGSASEIKANDCEDAEYV